MAADDLVAVARIVRPRGVRGEVVAELLTDYPERFDGLEAVTAVTASGERTGLEIEDHWFQKDRIVLKFASVDSIEAAEELRDAEICVNEDEAVELEEDEFFDWQLEGCRVETVDGTMLGEVRSLMRPGGTEVLVVKGEEKEYLIPFAASICVTVEPDARRIVVDPPEGLLDF